MKYGYGELKYRLAEILKNDSRATVSDLAKNLGVSRARISSMIEEMKNDENNTKFTIISSQDYTDLIVARVKSIEGLDPSRVVEYFEMIDSSYIVVIYYRDIHLLDGLPVQDISFARSRKIGDAISGEPVLSCDFCGKKIEANPIRVDVSGKLLYACCPNCSQDLQRNRKPLTLA